MDVFGSGKGRVDNTDESTDEIVGLLRHYFPQISESIRGQYDPQARAEVDIAAKYSPELGKIGTDLLETSGRDMSRIGRELSREEQLAAAQTEADILRGSGKDAVTSALELQKEADPEYFKSREALLEDLDKSFAQLGDPNQLSASESEGIARALGRTNSPVASPMQTISNAMTFGDAQAKRRAEYGSLVERRINATPALKSGFDAGSFATRRTVLPNFGQTNYTGIQTPGVNTSNTLGSSFLNNLTSIDMNRQNAYVAKTQGAGIGQGTGKIVGAIAAGAMCWVARAVYGEDDIRWLIFREWLLTDAPGWLRKAYMKYGPAFAEWLKNKPLAKAVVKWFMDGVVNSRS